MNTQVAINGLGRIGRADLKLVIGEPSIELVAVNDLATSRTLPICFASKGVRALLEEDYHAHCSVWRRSSRTVRKRRCRRVHGKPRFV